MKASTVLGATAAAATIALFSLVADAQEKAAPKAAPAAKAKPAACNSLKDEAGCKARDDCNWVTAVTDKKGKVTRKAYCRAKPKAPAKKK